MEVSIAILKHVADHYEEYVNLIRPALIAYGNRSLGRDLRLSLQQLHWMFDNVASLSDMGIIREAAVTYCDAFGDLKAEDVIERDYEQPIRQLRDALNALDTEGGETTNG